MTEKTCGMKSDSDNTVLFTDVYLKLYLLSLNVQDTQKLFFVFPFWFAFGFDFRRNSLEVTHWGLLQGRGEKKWRVW